jgi:hypothetical protein
MGIVQPRLGLGPGLLAPKANFRGRGLTHFKICLCLRFTKSILNVINCSVLFVVRALQQIT